MEDITQVSSVIIIVHACEHCTFLLPD